VIKVKRIYNNNKSGGKKMKNIFLSAIVIGALSISAVACYGKEAGKSQTGEALFKQHCAACHPGGGNIVNPAFTLHGKALMAHSITKPGDIVQKMRNPGPGMTKFDKKTIPDRDAKKIAEYVLKTFK
jgi:cytochrome c6